MDIEKEKSSAYGANLVWFLRELQQADQDLLSDGFIEVYGEDPAGNEGSCEVNISDLVREAADTVEQLRAKLAAMESLKAEINKLEEKIKHAKSQEPIGSLYVNAAGHVFRMGRVIAPDFTPVYLDPLSAPESAPADKPPRITDQDAREIAMSILIEPDSDLKKTYIDGWLLAEGITLLNKLNADREQVPAVAVPDGWNIVTNENWNIPRVGQRVILFSNGVVQEESYTLDQADGEPGCGYYFWNRDDLDECPEVKAGDMWISWPDAEAPSHSQQSADAHDKNSQRYLWIKENIQEEPTQESLRDSEYAEHKTCYKLPLLIAWADFCGHISLDDAIDNKISLGDRCPSHESEQ